MSEASGTNHRPAPRRVLMVCQDFVPSAIVGARRPGKFCKFLPEFGWSTRVLTVREEYYPQCDPESERDAATQCEIIRTGMRSLPRVVQVALEGVRRLRDRRWRQSAASSPEAKPPGAARAQWWVRVALPDPGLMWIGPALRVGRAAASGCDCIWSTYPWGANHMIARKLARESGLPWVVDFRDPWSFGAGQKRLASWKRRVNRRAEAQTVGTARFVISTTEEITERFRSEYPGEDAAKFVTIRNGVDPEDFPVVRTEIGSEDRGVFRAAYFGSLYGGRDPDGLFAAIRQLVDSGDIPADRLRFDLYGPKASVLDPMIARHGVGQVVRVRPSVSYRRALALMGQYTVLMVIGSEQTDDLCLATKLYEYRYARRPILALVPPGPIARFLRENRAGESISGQNAECIASTLRRWYEDFRAGRLIGPPEEFPPEFERRNQTGQLAGLLERAVTD